MQCPAAELKFRQIDDLVGEVKILDSADRNRLVVAEVQGVSRRARIDVNLGSHQRTSDPRSSAVSLPLPPMIVSLPLMRLNVEGVIAISALQRGIGIPSTTLEPELVVARAALHNVALHANQRVIAGAADKRAVPSVLPPGPPPPP